MSAYLAVVGFSLPTVLVRCSNKVSSVLDVVICLVRLRVLTNVALIIR